MGNLARALLSLDTVRLGDRLRLRLINAATARLFPLKIGGGSGRIVAHDGMPVPDPSPVSDLVLAPAQRTDIILDAQGPISFDLEINQGLYRLGTISINGTNPRPLTTPIAGLQPAGVPRPDLREAVKTKVVMEGGAMGGPHDGSDLWAFNDHSGMPDEPLVRIKRGATVRIALINDTAFPHGIHLHGHHFHELREDGTPGHHRTRPWSILSRAAISSACSTIPADG